jgi:hypothetical protein
MRAQIFHRCIIEKCVRREALETLAPVAQQDRATDFESVGWGFNSLQARSNSTQILDLIVELRVPSPPQAEG